MADYPQAFVPDRPSAFIPDTDVSSGPIEPPRRKGWAQSAYETAIHPTARAVVAEGEKKWEPIMGPSTLRSILGFASGAKDLADKGVRAAASAAVPDTASGWGELAGGLLGNLLARGRGMPQRAAMTAAAAGAGAEVAETAGPRLRGEGEPLGDPALRGFASTYTGEKVLGPLLGKLGRVTHGGQARMQDEFAQQVSGAIHENTGGVVPRANSMDDLTMMVRTPPGARAPSNFPQVPSMHGALTDAVRAARAEVGRMTGNQPFEFTANPVTRRIFPPGTPVVAATPERGAHYLVNQDEAFRVLSGLYESGYAGQAADVNLRRITGLSSREAGRALKDEIVNNLRRMDPQAAQLFEVAQHRHAVGLASEGVLRDAMRGGVDLRSPQVQQAFLDRMGKMKNFTPDELDRFANVVFREGGPGKDVLGSARTFLDAPRMIFRSGGGTTTGLMMAPRMFFGGLGDVYTGRQPGQLRPPTAQAVTAGAQRVGQTVAPPPDTLSTILRREESTEVGPRAQEDTTRRAQKRSLIDSLRTGR